MLKMYYYDSGAPSYHNRQFIHCCSLNTSSFMKIKCLLKYTFETDDHSRFLVGKKEKVHPNSLASQDRKRVNMRDRTH